MSALNLTRFRAVVAYDGTDFFGYQRQRDGVRTVQGEIERGLGTMAGRAVTVLGAGRTDTGVHAVGQVIAFDLAWMHGVETLRKALNANLPADIAVLEVAAAPAGFHPRFDALRRSYRYVIELCPQGVRNPLTTRYRWQIEGNLDLGRLNEAGAALVGTHDFAAFGSPPQGENSVRELFVAQWAIAEERVLHFDVEANAFLYRMVRTLVGTLKKVGDGRLSIQEFGDIFADRDRRFAAEPAPARGLTLMAVKYDM